MKRFQIVLLLMVASVAAAYAQEAQPQPGVARISLIHGDVSVQRGDSGDWVAAGLNTPVVNDDRVSTGDRSRTELQLDFANLLRLDQRSTARVANISRTRIQVQVGQGLANFDVLKGSEADAEIDTPNVAVHPLREGRYRIRVISDSETEVIVRKGEAEVTTPQGSTRVEHGQMITVQGSTNPQYQTASAPRKDDFDEWNGDRDNLIARADSWRYTDRYYTGASDLDAYGRWTQVPDYGSVWVPVVSAGWAPYRVGRWVWEPYYGWTWVSYEPWGWAPYHYGRWFLYGGSWCWWPGPVAFAPAYYPVWSPAYVSFFGFGADFSVGFGFGHIGWLPIGPADFYHPWYGRGVNTVNVTNITNINNINNINNITNVNNVRNGGGGTGGGLVTGSSAVAPLWRRATGHPYSNLRLAANNDPRLIRAVSTVPAEHFGTGSARVQPADTSSFRNAGVITGRVPVVPTRESLQPANKPASPSTIRANAGTQQRFFTRTQAQPAPAVRPFNQEVAQMQKIIGDSGRAQQAASPNLGSRAARTPMAPAAAAPATPVDKPVNVSGQPASAAKNLPAAQASQRPGWNRFGSDVAENRPAAAVGNHASGQSQSGDTNSAPKAGSRAINPPAASAASPARPGWHSFGSGADQNGSAASQSRTAQPQNQPADKGNAGGASRGPARNTDNNTGRGNWRRFGASSAGADSPAASPGSANRATAAAGRAEQNTGNNASSRDGGWQHFTPSGDGSRPQTRGNAAPAAPARDNGAAPQSRNGGWRTFTPRSESPASGSRSESSRQNSAERPPLDLRQPIVTRRSAPSYDSGPRSTYRPDSGMSRPSGGYARPSGAPSNSAPRGGGAPGGTHSAAGHASSGGHSGNSSGSHPH
jgi:hypothetical protein